MDTHSFFLTINNLHNIVIQGTSQIARTGVWRYYYLGPDVIMPLASILAAILGVILIFWRFLFNSAKRMYKALIRKFSKATPETESPADDPADSSGEA